MNYNQPGPFQVYCTYLFDRVLHFQKYCFLSVVLMEDIENMCIFVSICLHMCDNVSIAQLHNDYQLWNNELRFHEEELTTLQKQLDELIARNTSLQLSDEASMFQNQFVRMGDFLITLLHDLEYAKASMGILAKTGTPADFSAISVHNHWQLGQNITGFKKDFESLKHKYKMFQLKLY